jgi:hypothetical protein
MTILRRHAWLWSWVGSLLVMAGYWAPWVSHKSPALVLIGFDLGEFVKFTTEFRTGTLAGIREALWLPPAAAALLLALSVAQMGKGRSLLVRIAMSATGFLMAFTLLPPFPYRMEVLFSAEFRGQTVLALAGMVACLGAFVASQLRERTRRPAVWRWLAVTIAVVAFAGPVWEFWQLKPLLDRLYGKPVVPGLGIPLTAAGFALAALAAWGPPDS